MSAGLLSLGSVNADFQMRVDVPPGARPMLAGSGLVRLGGGKAGNVALLARRLGHAAVLLGRVGDDDLARQALQPLLEAGVDLSGVCQAHGEHTGLVVLMIPPDASKHSVSDGGANWGFDEEDITAIERRVKAADPGSVLVVDWEISPHAVAAAIAVARRCGLRVVADPSYAPAVELAELGRVDAVTPNQGEALELAGIEEHGPAAIAEAACALQARGVPLVCIKLDGGGCLMLHEGRLQHVQRAPVHVVDTTGAGDAFTGAMAVALLEGRPPGEAVCWAVAASDLVVGGFGAQPSYPGRDALLERVRATAWEVGPWPAGG